MVEVCSQCHPFYTGKQKILDSGGRVARFEKRYGKRAGATAREGRSRQLAAAIGARSCAFVRRAGRRFAFAGTFVEEAEEMTDTAPAIDALLAEHADLERQLADPGLHADAGAARKVGRRFAQIVAHRVHLPQAGNRPR